MTSSVARTPLLRKFPRTPHLTGSRTQPGDHGLASVPLTGLRGRRLVVEEKVDGANAAISFDAGGRLWLQSRGHFLTGGPRERHFAPFKAWAAETAPALWRAIRDRYVIYGEWLYAKHTIFYDALPHHFLEFDVLDTRTGVFLDTPSRRALLAGVAVCSVPVLWTGVARAPETLTGLVCASRYKTSGWRQALSRTSERLGLDVDRVSEQTDPSDEMEGLYLKVEDGGTVRERYKWVRASFSDRVDASGSHWQSRPVVPNLVEGAPSGAAG